MPQHHIPARRHFLRLAGGAVMAGVALSAGPGARLAAQARPQAAMLDALLDEAAGLAPLRSVILARHGEILAERGYRGHTTTAPGNIKSASKPVITALTGAAIARGLLQGTAQPIAPILRADIAEGADPRIEAITIGHLLTMQAGLGPTSGANYGTWVNSRNWVRAALARPFADEPGGGMLYSTGSTHLLSAILTRVSGRPVLDLARDWLGPVEEFAITGWQRDPQGIYLGGNEMAMSPRSLLAFGEMFRRGGRNRAGAQVLPPDWVAQSWTVYTRSVWSGDGYGYGWFMRRMAGEEIRYAWGYGGQMLYIVPRLGLSVVMTSDSTPRATTIADRDNLHALSAGLIGVVAA